jgi:hypothetical protein
MVRVQDFDASKGKDKILEDNIVRIGGRVSDHRKSLVENGEGEMLSSESSVDGSDVKVEESSSYDKEREIVKDAVKVWGKEISGEGELSSQQSSNNESLSDSVVAREMLPEYLSDDNSTVVDEVTSLIGIALQDDIEKALKSARKKTPFVEDAFHDALVDKVLPLLKERGLI